MFSKFEKTLTYSERLFKTFSGIEVDRAPVILPSAFISELHDDFFLSAKIKRQALLTSASAIAELSLSLRQETGLENLALPYVMTVESEAYGGETEGSGLFDFPLKSFADIFKVKKGLDPEKDGRLPLILRAIRELSDSEKNIPICGDLVGPMSLASSLIDPKTLLRGLISEPSEVRELLASLTSSTILFANALISNGVNFITITDPFSTAEILGRDFFKNFSLPYLKHIVTAIKKMGVSSILHLCGRLAPISEELKILNADVISVGSYGSVKELKNILPNKLLMGSLNYKFSVENNTSEFDEKVGAILSDNLAILSPFSLIDKNITPEKLRDATIALRRY